MPKVSYINLVVDDEPDDGPDHYVIITGFHHPHVIQVLADLGRLYL